MMTCILLSNVPDDESCVPVDPSEEPFEDSSGARTPPTPPVDDAPSNFRKRAMAQLQPVSLPDVVKSLAG